MRIGIHTECLSEPYTGVQILTDSLVRGLAKTKHEVTCFHTKNPQHLELSVKHHLWRALPRIPGAQRIASLFRRGSFRGIDILHLPYPQFPYVFKPKVPVVMTIPDLSPVLFPEFHGARRVFFFKHELPRRLKKVDAIIAISEATKRDIIKHYQIPEEKISVIYPSVPQGTKQTKREPFLLYVGTLEPRKNVEGILEAFSILKKEGFPYKLIIAGREGWKCDRLMSLIRQKKLGDDVEYRGYISEEEKMNLYRKARLLVWPSFYEGFGLPVAEAMAQGTPVVVSNTSSLPEIVGKAGVLVDPHDPIDIARGIKQALTQNLSKEAILQANQFTEERMIQETLRVYEKALARTR